MSTDYFRLAVDGLRAAGAVGPIPIANEAERRVYLLWSNDLLLGVFWTLHDARQEAHAWMDCHAGPWQEIERHHWTSHLIPRVCIEQRMVH